MTEREPIDTSTPWGRPRREPITQVDAERAAYERAAIEAMTRPGGGKIHRMSITTSTYEPNRPMAPDPNSLIAKKGMKPPGHKKVRVDKWDKIVVYAVLTCLVGMLSIIGYLFTRM
jgi:hypothetical protein